MKVQVTIPSSEDSSNNDIQSDDQTNTTDTNNTNNTTNHTNQHNETNNNTTNTNNTNNTFYALCRSTQSAEQIKNLCFELLKAKR